MGCSFTGLSIDKKVEVNKKMIEITKELERRIAEKNPHLPPGSDVIKETAVKMANEMLNIPTGLNKTLKRYALYGIYQFNGKEARISVGDIERTPSGYRVLYFTDKKETMKVTHLNKNGKNPKGTIVFDIDNISNTVSSIEYEKKLLAATKKNKNAEVDVNAAYERLKLHLNKRNSTKKEEIVGTEKKPANVQETLFASFDDKTTKNTGYDFEKRDGIIHSPEAAKQFLDDINEISEEPENDNHIEYLKTVIESALRFDGKNIPQELELYVADAGGTSAAWFNSQRVGREAAGVHMYLGTRSKDNMSQAEKFVHEVVHASTYYALESGHPEVSFIKNRIDDLHKLAIEKITPEMLVSDDMSKADAEKLLKYLSGKSGIHEFIAYSMTNANFKNALSQVTVYEKKKETKGLFDAIKNVFTDIASLLLRMTRSEKSSQKADASMAALVSDLMALNNETERRIKEGRIGQFVEDNIDSANDYLVEKMNNYADEKVKEGFRYIPKNNDSKATKAMWIMRNLLKYWANPHIRPHYENVLSQVGPYFSPNSLVQSAVRSFVANDKLEDIVENLGLMSVKLDNNKTTINSAHAKTIRTMFNDDLSRDESEMLTTMIIDKDLQSLGSDYNFMRLITEEGAMDREISRIKKRIFDNAESESDYNFYIGATKKLARFLLDGTGDESTLLNASNIAHQIGRVDGSDYVRSISGKNKDIDNKNKLQRDIDKLSSLLALKDESNENLQMLEDVHKRHPDAVMNLLAMHSSYVKEISSSLFSKSKINMIKGYSAEIFDGDADIRFAPTSDSDKLIREGYARIGPVPSNPLINDLGEMSMYKHPNAGIAEYTKQATRTTTGHRRGNTIEDMLIGSIDRYPDIHTAAKKITRRVKAKTNAGFDKMAEGKSEPGYGMIPIFDASGNITTYRYMMSKKNKKEILTQDKRIGIVFGHMNSRAMDQLESNKINKKVIDVMIDDADENWIPGQKFGSNHKPYIMVGPDTEHKDTWFLLPEPMRNELENKMRNLADSKGINKDFEGVSVREDLKRMYFGERDASIINAPLIKLTPTQIRSAIAFAERLWKSIIKIAKVDIVIRTPSVWIGNVVSNLMLSMQLGMTPMQVFRMQLRGVDELNRYKKTESEIVNLQIFIKKQKALGKNVKKEVMKLNQLKESQERNSIKPLIDAGLFSAIIDDIKGDDIIADNKLGSFIDKKLENTPQFVKNGANYLYFTERTSLYQLMLKITQYGDFVARYGLYHASIEKAKTKNKKRYGKEFTKEELEKVKRQVINNTRDAFINYNVADHPIEKWVNDMGLIMFTKFFKRIQKVIVTGIQDNPARAMISLFAQLAFIDIEDPTDSSLLTKDMSVFVKNPFDNFHHAFYPTILEVPSLIEKSVGGLTH